MRDHGSLDQVGGSENGKSSMLATFRTYLCIYGMKVGLQDSEEMLT